MGDVALPSISHGWRCLEGFWVTCSLQGLVANGGGLFKDL